MKKDEQGYNGWKNYETWCVALWIDNEELSYNTARSQAKYFQSIAKKDNNVPEIWTEEQAAKYRLSEWLRDYIENNSPLVDEANMYTDLLNKALSEVDWDEVAEHYIEN